MRVVLLSLALLAPVQSLDQAVRDWVQRQRTPTGTRVAQAISDIGRPPIVIGALTVIALLDRAAGAAFATRALAALAGTNLTVEVVKRVTDRARPDGEHKRSNASFPSSHAANAATLAVVLSRRWRRWAPAFVALALVVSGTRVYLDRHWLSDVVVGLAIGILFAWLAERWLTPIRRPSPRTSVERA